MSGTKLGGQKTFSKGIWKSVWLVTVGSAAITHVVPQIKYLGDFPTSALVDGKHGGFSVEVGVHLWAAAASSGQLSLDGDWGGSGSTASIAAPAGESKQVLTINATAEEIRLWWPVGHGAQPLYNISVSYSPTGAGPIVKTTRRVGFRMFALVTGNDTDAAWVAANKDGDGTASQGMFWRVNGAAIFSKGANSAMWLFHTTRFCAQLTLLLFIRSDSDGGARGTHV